MMIRERFHQINYLIFWVILSLCFPAMLWAVDPLSKGHAHLDQRDQCEQCHTDPQKGDSQKCRSCHLEIDQRIKESKGFHGRLSGNVDCNICHKEHLGRNYKIIQLNEKVFDHQQTGWKLSGKHAQTPCKQCHTEKRAGGNQSYLGTSPECKNCHGEYHGQGEKTDLTQCEECHNAFSWQKLNADLTFNHEKNTRFPRTGKHLQVECKQCHQDSKQFGPMELQGCQSCHKDPHPAGIFKSLICEDCHVTSAFKNTQGFDHKSTGWALKGKHQQAKCLDCHQWKNWAPPSQDCASCHEDVHRGQFDGQNCDKCHQEKSFKDLIFNHNTQSHFPLKGKHQKVECGKCHPDGKYKPITKECRECHQEDNPHGTTYGDEKCSKCHSPVGWKNTHFDHSITGFDLEERHSDQPCFRCHPAGTQAKDDTRSECSYCHKDIHFGQFQIKINDALPSNPESKEDCNRCHQGFSQWSISFFDHNKISRFEINGKHQELKCDDCHKNGHFKPIDQACGNCHQNFHEGQFSKACDQCHQTSGWQKLKEFNHQTQTQYPLLGLHQKVDCGKCHLDNRYKPIQSECHQCHLDIHKGEKGSHCEKCHQLDGWDTNQSIAHDFGAFRLEGVHNTLPCERCHGENRKKELSGTGPECKNCHIDPHFGSFGPMCNECHTQNEFLPSTFLHNQTGFRLSGAHRFVECRACHPNRIYGGLSNDCSFCHTDTFQSTSGSDCDHPANCPTGINGCEECHTTTSFIRARAGVSCGKCQSGGKR
jgi:hypothetical protein